MNSQRLSNILNWAKSVEAPEDIILQLEEEMMPLIINESNDLAEIFGVSNRRYEEIAKMFRGPASMVSMINDIVNSNITTHEKLCFLFVAGIEVGSQQ